MEWRGCHRDWLAGNTENVYSLALYTEVFWPLAHTVPYLKDSIKNLALILRAEEAYEDFPFRRIALAAQWWKAHRLHRSVHSQPELGWPFTVSTLLSWASILKESPCRKPLWLLPEDDLLGPSQPLGVPSKDEAPGTWAHPELNYWGVLDQLWQQFPRFFLYLMVQMESMYYILQKIQQSLQEHHKQAESFLWTMETWSWPLGFQPRKYQVSQVSSGWDCLPGFLRISQIGGFPIPSVQDPIALQSSGTTLQRCHGHRSSDRNKQPSGADTVPVYQLDMQPS